MQESHCLTAQAVGWQAFLSHCLCWNSYIANFLASPIHTTSFRTSENLKASAFDCFQLNAWEESFVFNISDHMSSHGLKPPQADRSFESRPCQWPLDNEVTGRFQTHMFASAQVLWGCVDMCQGYVKAHRHFYKAQAFPKWPTCQTLPFHVSEQDSVWQLRPGSGNDFI